MTRILVDTSVWVAHFREANPLLQSLLVQDRVLCHPMVLIEIACGTPPAPRERTLSHLKKLQQGVIASSDEILSLIETEKCCDAGCGATDLALLASALLTGKARLWTLDKNLAALAARMKIGFDPKTTRQPT